MVDLTAPGEAVIVPCDAGAVRRVVMNLLDNAVKFSPVGGKVRVTLSRDDARVRIAVTDSGPGVPAGFREKIFDHFAQMDARGYSTGIGLSFCRMAARAHGGDVTIESVEGEGSTFTVSLPLSADLEGADALG
jgi:signal transduction histidine kinase